MNRMSKQYMKNVKTLFPTIGKPEKAYLQQLELAVEDYCTEKGSISLEKLYDDFGTPADVVHTYYSNVNIEYFLKRLNISKKLKALIVTLFLSILVSTLAYCIVLYQECKIMKSQQIFSEKTYIE